MENGKEIEFKLQVGYLHLNPNTSKSDKTRAIVTLPRGDLKQIVIRLLSGNGQKVGLTIARRGQTLYQSNLKEKLSTRGFKSVDFDSFPLVSDETPFVIEGYNTDKEKTARVYIEFAFVVPKEREG